MSHGIVFACGAGCGLLLASISCERKPPRTQTQAAAPAPIANAAPRPLSVGPLTFFQGSCARCHGMYGGNYGEVLGGLDDEHLVRAVEDMILGPAMTELPPADAAAQVAYHRSLIDGRPFLAITESSETRVAGEVTPGSSVAVFTGDTRIEAEIRGHAWHADLPRGKAELRVLATAPGGETVLDASQRTHSHPSR